MSPNEPQQSWLVSVPQQVVEFFRTPGPDGYAQRARYTVGETISPEAFPDVRIEVTRLFRAAASTPNDISYAAK